jgi:chromosome partitioning protein
VARVISIVNQKGGVGKTTTAVNLSAYLAQLGKFVLLIDTDPQGNATSAFGFNHRQLDKGIYEGLMGHHQFNDVVLKTNFIGHKLAPATPDLAGANIELVTVPEREFRLREVLAESRHGFDYVIIDCPPSLGLLTINALTAADEVLIPVQTEYYALEGLSQLLETISLVRDNLHSNLTILGAVMTMYDERAKLSDEVFHELYRYFPEKIFRTVIPRNIALAEAPSHGQTIFEYNSGTKGARAYKRLAREILSKNNYE